MIDAPVEPANVKLCEMGIETRINPVIDFVHGRLRLRGIALVTEYIIKNVGKRLENQFVSYCRDAKLARRLSKPLINEKLGIVRESVAPIPYLSRYCFDVVVERLLEL